MRIRLSRPLSASSSPAYWPVSPMRALTWPGCSRGVESEHPHLALVRSREGRDDPDQGGLPRAVRPEQRGQRAWRDGEIHPVERLTWPNALTGCLDGGADLGMTARLDIAHIVRLAVSEVTGQYA